MEFLRASGILMHPTSLPSEFGIGDFGRNAYQFVDFLEDAKQTYWQILPLGQTGYGDSPYQCFSAFAGNINLISPQILFEEGLLAEEELANRPDFPSQRVDYSKVIEWKKEILQKAYERFRHEANLDLRGSFEIFTAQVADWLEDYALFRAIKENQGGKSWLDWDKPLRKRDKQAILDAREQLAEEILAEKFYQFLFLKQWTRLKNYANGKGIKIIGDLPIFVSLDSCDVWRNPTDFKLNKDLSPTSVAGVPPDYFSKTGQLWGNPIYDWEKMQGEGFKWWVKRLKFTLKTVDILRIDHFRGFVASWEVPGKDKTAEHGKWVKVPGNALFKTLSQRLPILPVIAEDLGDITPEVLELRDRFGFAGMRILLFGFGGDSKNLDLPHNYVRNCVAYSGTHDNDTAIGWFEAGVRKKRGTEKEKIGRDQEFALKYLNSDGNGFNWDMIRAIWASVADVAIVPMQDVLGLDNNSRMNMPSSKSGNWQWRVTWDAFSKEDVERLRELTLLYGRAEE